MSNPLGRFSLNEDTLGRLPLQPPRNLASVAVPPPPLVSVLSPQSTPQIGGGVFTVTNLPSWVDHVSTPGSPSPSSLVTLDQSNTGTFTMPWFATADYNEENIYFYSEDNSQFHTVLVQNVEPTSIATPTETHTASSVVSVTNVPANAISMTGTPSLPNTDFSMTGTTATFTVTNPEYGDINSEGVTFDLRFSVSGAGDYTLYGIFQAYPS